MVKVTSLGYCHKGVNFLEANCQRSVEKAAPGIAHLYADRHADVADSVHIPLPDVVLSLSTTASSAKQMKEQHTYGSIVVVSAFFCSV